MITLSPPIQAVFFDFNGTLIRDRSLHYQAFAEILARYHLPLSPEDYETKAANKINREIWPALLGRPLEQKEIAKLSQQKEQRYFELLTNLTPTPGIQPLLKTLQKQGIYTSLVTSAPNTAVQHLLPQLGLTGYFNDIITSSLIQHGKPNPEIYYLALEHAQVKAAQAVTFEDSPQGVAASIAAGIRTIGVLPEYLPQLLAAQGAREFIHDFTEVGWAEN